MFIASWFEVLVAKPIFNLLVFIYSILPGHDFGLAIILFTILVRVLMWPVVRKQLHQTKLMRELQPELKRIKKAAAGNRQKEGLMMQELYKERGINPFSSIGMLLIQVVILFGLYAGLKKLVTDPGEILTYSYSLLHHLGWMQALTADVSKFDASLFGAVDLTRAAINTGGGIYWPAMLLVAGSAIVQYFQSGQLMPKPKDGRRLRDILREAGDGKKADTSEVNAAVMGGTRYFLPFMIFIFTVNIASALSLYWFVSGLVAYWQQAKVLNNDEQEMEVLADKPAMATVTTAKAARRERAAIEADVITQPSKTQKTQNPKPTKSSKKKSNKRSNGRSNKRRK